MLGETLAIAKRLDVDPQAFLNAIKGGPLDIGYAQLKGPQMIAREYPTSFPLAMALKVRKATSSALYRAQHSQGWLRALRLPRLSHCAVTLDHHRTRG